MRKGDYDFGIVQLSVKIASGISVDLQVDEAMRKPRGFVGGARFNCCNAALFDGDAKRLPAAGISA